MTCFELSLLLLEDMNGMTQDIGAESDISS